MPDMTSVTIPKPTRVRLASMAKTRGLSQPALIDEMLAKAEEEQFWASFSTTTPESYQAATQADGDQVSEDYTLENQKIRDEESRESW